MFIIGVIYVKFDFGKKNYIINIFMYFVNNEKFYLFIIIILVYL